MHLMAANIDQALLIVTLREPMLKSGFIDRYLLMTEPYDIPVIILFNKRDVYQPEDFTRLELLEEIYQNIDYPIISASAINGENFEQLRTLLMHTRTLFRSR